MNCNICAADLRFLNDKGYVKDKKYYCTHCYKKYVKTGGKRHATVAEWQSTLLINGRSKVQIFPVASSGRGGAVTHQTVDLNRGMFKSCRPDSITNLI